MSPRGPRDLVCQALTLSPLASFQARPIYADLSSRAEQMPRRHSSLRTVDLPEPLSPTMRRVPKVLSASMWSQIVLIAVAVGWELMWSLWAEVAVGPR